MTDETRPTPEEMLARAHAEADAAKKGRLAIYFGAAPGVGKTFAMLTAARRAHAEGVDVVIGLVETHGRRETAELLTGLPFLPPRIESHRGIEVREFDLDAALARRPRCILVDELAHTNAAGSRHRKRWQDVLELLDAGIDVATTLNVQHVESVVDVVARITGVRVRETVPDAVLERAAEIHLVDLSPDDLLQRLRQGKVYLGAQARQAVENFFKKGNLIALRELALRTTATRVDAQMQEYRAAHGIEGTWPAGEKVLVCVGPAPQSAGLIRAARRVAEALRAPWFAVTVETPASSALAASDRARLEGHLRLAASLGAVEVVLGGESIAAEVLAFARRENVTKIVCGKPVVRGVLGGWRRSVVDELVRGSAGIDLYFPQIAETEGERTPDPRVTSAPPRAYLGAGGIVASTALAAWLARAWISLADVAMALLLGIVLAGLRFGRGPSLAAAGLTILLFNFLFVPPLFTFAVDDTRHLLTFAVMLVVGAVVGTLAGRFQRQLERSREQARRLQLLGALGRDLAIASDAREIAQVVVRRLVELGARGAAWFAAEGETATPVAEAGEPFADDAKEASVAVWVVARGKPAGRGTETLAGARALHVPIPGLDRTIGALALLVGTERTFAAADERALLEQMTREAGGAVERTRLSDDVRRAQVVAETDRLRSSLLDSVSHDLRTPLASITGAAATLLEAETRLGPAERSELLRTIHEEAERLGAYVGNLLDMTRLDSGGLRPNLEWHSLEEIVGTALAAVRRTATHDRFAVEVPTDLPLLFCDDLLVRQVLINLLENALRHAPPGSTVRIGARVDQDLVLVAVLDEGPGFAPGTEESVFEKFFRDRSGGGIGLGLTIARGFVEAHGGTIIARNRREGGAEVTFILPLRTPPDAEPAVG